jgi:hypothetical protein
MTTIENETMTQRPGKERGSKGNWLMYFKPKKERLNHIKWLRRTGGQAEKGLTCNLIGDPRITCAVSWHTQPQECLQARDVLAGLDQSGSVRVSLGQSDLV